MYPFKYVVSFRITHPSMKPEDISNKLGLDAKYKWMAGAERRTPKGDLLSGRYDKTYCCFNLKHPKTIGLSDFLKRYNKKLYKHKKFFEHIRSTRGTLEYFIGWFSDIDSGEIFDFMLLNQLAELKIDLAISVYGKENSKEGEAQGTSIRL